MTNKQAYRYLNKVYLSTKNDSYREALSVALIHLFKTFNETPLSLQELREMNGEPVWGKSLINDKPGEWFIIRVGEMSKTWFIACAGSEQGFGDKDNYGKTWVAYAHRPEKRR